MYVNGSLSFQVSVKGASATSVMLLSNDALLADLPGPPYAFTWDTAASARGPVPEGIYSITARATVDGHQVTSAPVTVVVDRTPPTAERRPAGRPRDGLPW